MTKRFNVWLLAALIVIVPAYFIVFLDKRASEVELPRITLADLREAAALPGGELPVSLRVERTRTENEMGNIVAAGAGLRFDKLSEMAFLASFEDRAPVVVETSGEAAGDPGNPVSRERLEIARASSQAVFRLDSVQSDDRLDAVAPGVVLIRTDAPSQGNAMAYVRLRDGREYLLAGDVAPLSISWMQARPPARYVDLFRSEIDRSATLAWLRWIRRLKAENPPVRIIAGRDFGRVVSPKTKTGIGYPFPQPEASEKALEMREAIR